MKDTTVLIWTDVVSMIVVDVDFRLTYPMPVLLWFIATIGGATMRFFRSPIYLMRVYRIGCCMGTKDPLARNCYTPLPERWGSLLRQERPAFLVGGLHHLLAGQRHR